MEKGKGQEKDETFLSQGERKRGRQRVLPLQKASKNKEVAVRKKIFSTSQNKGETASDRRQAGKSKVVERNQACHLQVRDRMSKPTPTACLLANTLISWRGFWQSGELNTAKEKTESNAVRMMQGAVSESVVEIGSRA